MNFSNHIIIKISKSNKALVILRELHNILPGNSLIIIYKSFIRPHLGYGTIIFDQPEKFCKKIKSVQYNAALAITGAIQVTSREKLYKELDLETLKSRRWLKKLCCFYKIKNNGIPSYLAELIPSEFHLYNTRNTRNITTYSCRTDAFKYSFFPWTINEWNKLNFSIRASSFNIFRANLIKIIRPIPNSVFGIFNPLGLKLITRLRLGLSHLNEHRFKHNFNDCINPLCTCSLDIESTVHYFLHCNYYNSARISLLNDLNSVDRTLFNLSNLSLVNVLLYGGPQFDDFQNIFILNTSIKYKYINF